LNVKIFDYEFWSADVDMQIIPYKKILQHEHILVVSLKPIPQAIKDRLNNLKVDVIDNVYPDGPGEEQLVKYIRNVLC
jgi:aryl-alcohol dehydrogenase-like predicted oxidoreductase